MIWRALSQTWKPRPPGNQSAQEWLSAADAPVRVLAVGNLHVHLATAQERRRLQRAEEELFNGLRFPIQRFALPVPLDLSEYLERLYTQAIGDPRKDRAAVLYDKVIHVQSLIHERCLVLWRNLVVIPFDEATGAERLHYVRSGLERMGLPVRELGLDELTQVWLEVLSPEIAAERKSQTSSAPLLDRVTPVEGLDFSGRQHFRMGSKRCRVLVVRDYPRHVRWHMLQDIYRLDPRVVVVQHVHPGDSTSLQREISNSIGEMRTRSAMHQSPYEAEANRARLRDAERVLRKLAGENHNVLDFCMYLLVRADTDDELEDLCRAIAARLAGMGMRARPVHFWQHEAALRTCLPVARDELRELARRNIPAASVPATFPYANAELNHGEGYVFGINKATGNLVIFDPWSLMNAHSVFIGMSGAGKTFTLNEGTIQFWSRGTQIRSLDIEGDKGRLCTELKGQRVRIAPYAGNYINPMEVRRPPLDPSLFVGAEAEEPSNGLSATIQRQLILFSLMLPDANPVELSRAEALLIDAYRAAQITFETDFARVPRTAWPTWRELHPLLKADRRTARLAAVMQSWVDGSLAGMFDRHTSVDLDNQYVLLDIHDIMGHRLARGPVFFQAMTFLWDEINRDWRQPKIMDIDELGILADSEDALAFVWMLSKSARRRNCRLQVATQDPADFLTGKNPACAKYALGILNNCATKVVGYLERQALEQVATAIRLSESEQELIAGLDRTEKLLICGDQRAHIEVVASLAELRILDPERYKAITGTPA